MLFRSQTRVANFTTTTTPGATTQGTATVTSDTFGSYGSWSSQSLYGYYNGYCGGYWNTTTSSGGSEGAAYNQQSTTSGNTTTVTWSTNTTVTQYEYTESNYTYGGNRYCLVYVRNRSAVETKQYSRTDTTSAPTTSTAFSDWTYDQHSWDISSLKAGNDTWNSSVSLPVGTNGASKSISWDGCIEERQTVRTTDFSPIPTDAYDLDIDKIPTTSDPATQWGPALPNAVWGRYNNGGNNQYSALTTSNDLYPNIYYSCPVQAKKLQAWPTASAFETYVDSLTPSGNTYHDIGLVWGARLMSPGDANGNGGLFAAENKLTSQGGEIERHLIFMTDGDACTDLENYTGHGVDWYNPVTLPSGTNPTEGCTSTGNLTFDLGALFKVGSTKIWNYGPGCCGEGRSVKDLGISVSTDGVNYTDIGAFVLSLPNTDPFGEIGRAHV